MRIGILTSSRADFGIYLPLLKALKMDDFFEFEIIAFGTHLSPFHGLTINQIQSEGFHVKYTVESMLLGDTPEAIATAMGVTYMKFASFWKEHVKDFDLVFCLGDRYEMFSAVIAGVPFQIKFVHLYGGEKTLGAIDNVFRHSISHASSIHFTSTLMYADRLNKMLDETKHIYTVGAISLDNIKQIKLLSHVEFENKWGIDLHNPTVLMTFHPETLNANKNGHYAEELVRVIKSNPQYQFLITMPNADTAGTIVREIFIKELETFSNVFMIENLGTQSYFTAMKYCEFLLGNTSSGIIEAASFGKYVINIGDRQKGREKSMNILQVPLTKESIQLAIMKLKRVKEFSGENIYFKKNSVMEIIKILKRIGKNG